MATKLDKQIIGELAALADTPLPEGKDDLLRFAKSMPGVGVRVRRAPDGAERRAWIVQYRQRDGSKRQRRQIIGDVARLRATAAYELARDVFASARLGGSPADDRAEANRKGRHTLGTVLPEFLEHKRTFVRQKIGEAVRPVTLAIVRRHLEQNWKGLHSTPLAQITPEKISERLNKIKSERGRDAKGHKFGGPTCARQALFVLSELFVWAIGETYTDANPTLTVNRPSGPKVGKNKLSEAELVAIWRACGAADYSRIIKLLILTLCRRAEIGSLRWSEVKSDMLKIPGERMKNHADFELPLSPLALQIIGPVRLGRECVFGKRDGVGFNSWSNNKTALDARLGDQVRPWIVHDLRRSVATLMGDVLKIEPHIVDCILGHSASTFRAGSAGAYIQSVYSAQVRKALTDFAGHVAKLVAEAERNEAERNEAEHEVIAISRRRARA